MDSPISGLSHSNVVPSLYSQKDISLRLAPVSTCCLFLYSLPPFSSPSSSLSSSSHSPFSFSPFSSSSPPHSSSSHLSPYSPPSPSRVCYQLNPGSQNTLPHEWGGFPVSFIDILFLQLLKCLDIALAVCQALGVTWCKGIFYLLKACPPPLGLMAVCLYCKLLGDMSLWRSFIPSIGGAHSGAF